VPSGQHHLVVVVRTAEGDLVIDTLNANISPPVGPDPDTAQSDVLGDGYQSECVMRPRRAVAPSAAGWRPAHSCKRRPT
jgi:hypothetical protein